MLAHLKNIPTSIVVPPQVISLRPYITVTHGLLLPGEPDQIIARAAPQLRRCNHQLVFLGPQFRRCKFHQFGFWIIHHRCQSFQIGDGWQNGQWDRLDG